jgi:hypothetical protein
MTVYIGLPIATGHGLILPGIDLELRKIQVLRKADSAMASPIACRIAVRNS